MFSGREQETVRTYGDGEVIFREGDDGREMFVIQSGAVRISCRTESGPLTIGDLHRGEFFGEMALLEGQPRSATVTALGETTVLVLNPGALMLRFRRDPTFALEMVHVMSRKLRRVTDDLVTSAEDKGRILQTLEQGDAAGEGDRQC